MAKRDYYEVLGVNKNSTDAEIKSAYRKLARQHHPDVDKSDGAAERFKEVSEAYQILSDPTKRKSYDQFGHAGASNPFAGGGPFGGANPFGGFGYSYGGGGFEDPFDLFESIFGGTPFSNAFRRRPTYQMNLSFNEAIKGTNKEVEVQQQDRKTGQVKRERMTIKVPAGVDNDTRIRFGEIDIIFQVKDHPKFAREGADIFTDETLTIPQIVLGDVIEVETVDGLVKIKVPAGTQPETLVKIKGKGVPSLRGGKGDHFVRVKLEVPKQLSAKERKLYEELRGKDKKNWF